MLTNLQLVAFCLKAVSMGAKYWYGTYWLKAALSILTSKSKQYPDHYGSNRTSTYQKHIAEGRMVCDCVGMIKGFFWSQNGAQAATAGYGKHNCPDTNANGMYKLCKVSGPIKTLPDTPGLIVWNSGHIGVSLGDGYAIEARGFAHGVVKTKIKDRSWTNWGRLPMLEYVADSTLTPAPSPAPGNDKLGARTLDYGKTGNDVKALQTELKKHGFFTGTPHGNYLDLTKAAVTAFQRAHKLETDGVYGPKSHEKLMSVIGGTSEQATPEPQKRVVISGGNWWVRAQPLVGKQLDIARNGMEYPYLGETKDGWLKIRVNEKEGYVSGKGAKVQ